MMETATKGNLLGEDLEQKVNYPTTEERILIHEAICKRLGENLTSEKYVEICEQYCIETPTMPSAYR